MSADPAPSQPIRLRRRTAPERLEYLADQLGTALDRDHPSDPAGLGRIRSVQMCLLAMAAEFTEDDP